MKRATLGIGAAVIASVALMLALRAQERRDPAPPAQDPPVSPSQEQAAFTFSDDAQMQQFTQLWQQRQAAVTRMAVLQAYWNQEQGALAQMNQQLLSQYHLDVNKNYSLDTDRKLLVERPATPAQPAPGDQAQAPPASAAQATP